MPNSHCAACTPPSLPCEWRHHSIRNRAVEKIHNLKEMRAGKCWQLCGRTESKRVLRPNRDTDSGSPALSFLLLFPLLDDSESDAHLWVQSRLPKNAMSFPPGAQRQWTCPHSARADNTHMQTQTPGMLLLQITISFVILQQQPHLVPPGHSTKPADKPSLQAFLHHLVQPFKERKGQTQTYEKENVLFSTSTETDGETRYSTKRKKRCQQKAKIGLNWIKKEKEREQKVNE